MARPHTFYRIIPVDMASRRHKGEPITLIPPGGPISRHNPVECMRPLPHSIVLQCHAVRVTLLCIGLMKQICEKG